MKILAIIGSPRRGNSYKVAQAVEQEMKRLGKDVEFNYLFLREVNLEPCRGCGLCLTKGDNYCPVLDSRPDIEKQMTEADGIIFASPVYVMNVSGLMKNFIDRFAYICHRPRFFGKYALLVSTTGALGLNQALNAMRWPVMVWGFSIVGKLGVVASTLSPSD